MSVSYKLLCSALSCSQPSTCSSTSVFSLIFLKLLLMRGVTMWCGQHGASRSQAQHCKQCLRCCWAGGHGQVDCQKGREQPTNPAQVSVRQHTESVVVAWGLTNAVASCETSYPQHT